MNALDYTDPQEVPGMTVLRRTVAVLSELDDDIISTLSGEIAKAVAAGKSVHLLGNGGCAAVAAHVVADFDRPTNDSRRIKFLTPFENMARMTMLINDVGWENSLVQYAKTYVEEHDLIVAMSSSNLIHKSENIRNCLAESARQGAHVVLMRNGDRTPDESPPVDSEIIVAHASELPEVYENAVLALWQAIRYQMMHQAILVGR